MSAPVGASHLIREHDDPLSSRSYVEEAFEEPEVRTWCPLQHAWLCFSCDRFYRGATMQVDPLSTIDAFLHLRRTQDAMQADIDQPEDNIEIMEGQEGAAAAAADRPRITTRCGAPGCAGGAGTCRSDDDTAFPRDNGGSRDAFSHLMTLSILDVRSGLSSHEDSSSLASRYMTKYEKARVLGTRALQISMNAPVMVQLSGETDPLDIALKELRSGGMHYTMWLGHCHPMWLGHCHPMRSSGRRRSPSPSGDTSPMAASRIGGPTS